MGRVGWLCLLVVTVAITTAADPSLDLPVRRADQSPPPQIPQPPVGPAPAVAPPPVELYGEPLPVTQSIVFVVDESSSMTISRWAKLQAEVQGAVGQLAESARFNLLAFSDQSTPWQSDLRQALPGNKASAAVWLAARKPYGGTNTAPAVIAAAGSGCELVVLVTDGRPGGRSGQAVVPGGMAPEQWHAKQIVRNVDCPVWVFGIDVDERGRWFGRAVASGTGGMYVEP